MANERDRKVEEREKLRTIISQWNANRLDIFWLSEPNEELEFHGAMRFYFQDSGQKVATKCIRVSSTATTYDVITTLIEKFRPDIRMLSVPEYALYEIHENGEERKLRKEEKPILVQLDWHKDDREGRFLLRRMDEKSYLPSLENCEGNSLRRKLSKREKKKREKKEKLKLSEEDRKNGIAERLYNELPETSFTRSISNPDAVMRRRRQQKLERRLQQFRQEGGTEAGGTLRIFGESLNKDVPYKTLLLSTKDTAAYVVKEILEKYGYDKEDPNQYCLVQTIIPQPSGGDVHEFHGVSGVREYILDDDDCPLSIEHQHNRLKGILSFHVRRRPADYQPRKRKKRPKTAKGDTDSYKYEDTLERLPYLLELNPDGSEFHGTPKKHRLYLNVTEVGCERSSSTGGQYLQLFGPNIQPRHCVIAHTEGIVTVTPSSRDAETYVNNIRIYETTILQHGMIVRFGKMHTFRFVDPGHDQRTHMSHDSRQASDYLERTSRMEDQLSLQHHGSYETTFDTEGNVETVSTHSRDDRVSRKSDDVHSHRSLGRESVQDRGSYDKYEQRRGADPILPAVLEFWEEGEDAFLTASILQLDPAQVQFKLAPTYTLYMAARYRASTHFRPEITPSERAHRLTALMNKVASMIHQVIQDRYRDASALAFWLANASELLHFLKQDRHLSAYTLDAQDLLAESVQLAFRSSVTCQQGEIQAAMPAFLEDREDVSEEEGTTADVLSVLTGAMSLLRRCRVNAALTIQMFSQLFHYINMWLFNKVICETHPNLCTRLWGVRLKRRLGRVEAWAEKQGLELAADCHLSRIVQAAHLLQAPKSSPDDIAAISSSCFKLNSLQLRILLEKYGPVADEPLIPQDLIDSVVKVAENTADELARSDGREVKLEEDTDLQLPFLLPEDGYSCDIVRGVPAGLQEFLQPLVQTGFCRVTVQPSSSGYWTIYMSDQDVGHVPSGACTPIAHPNIGDGEGSVHGSVLPADPEVVAIRLQKSNNGIGLSIVAAGGVDQDRLGIYVKSVVKGGAADLDGRLQAGDQLLKVDGQSLVGVSQEKAAELMTRTGPIVTLEIAKQGAIYHGLAALLSKPSPVMQRGPRRLSERDIPSRLMHEHGHDARLPTGPGQMMSPRIQGSKSVPSLNSGHNNQEPVRALSNGSIMTHEMYNPAYSRTSSTTSIPKATEFPLEGHENGPRSRSTNNLCQEQYDARYPHSQPVQNPAVYPGPVGGLNNRPVSQPNLHQQQQQAISQEERHYQNISMYQQNNFPHQRPPQLYPQQQQHLQPPSRPLHGSQSSLNRPDQQLISPGMDRGRPLSTLVSPREQEQYANSLSYGHPPGHLPPHPNQEFRHPGHKGPEFRESHPQLDQRYPEGEGKAHYPDGVYNEQPHHRNLFPPQQGYINHHHQGHIIDTRQRDLLRQEAKMEEMREEVRRREERERVYHQQSNRPVGPQFIPGRQVQGIRHPPPSYSPSGQYGPPPVTHQHPYAPGVQQPPPPAPKPKAAHPYPQGIVSSERLPRPGYDVRYEIPDGPPPGYRESPPPAPSSAHPLILQQHPRQPPPPAVSYRYGPTGYPPRSGEPHGQPPIHVMHDDARSSMPYNRPPQPQSQNPRVTFDLPPSGQGSTDKKDGSSLISPSPWEREEKEKVRKQRLEEARRARDIEIKDLESLPHRTQKQEERLRTLRLEQEFQRRAEELHGEEEEEDDDDLLDRAENRERMLKMQEDLERARQRRMEWEQEYQQQQQQKQNMISPQEEWRRHHERQQNIQLEEQEGRLRQLKLEEVHRKRELEAAKEAEECLLREARRRQDEEYRSQKNMHQQQRVTEHVISSTPDNPVQAQKTKKEDPSNCVQDLPPPLPTSPPPPLDSNYPPSYNQNNMQSNISQSQRAPSGAQRLDSLLTATSQHTVNNSATEKPLGPPAPPERKSSYEVTTQMSVTGNNRLITNSALRNGDNNNSQHQPKKVSFHDSRLQTEMMFDANGNHDSRSHISNSSISQSYTLQDIDEVLATPQNSLNQSSFSSGNTPGVIGTQEIYRDPRHRIEAERMQHDHLHVSRNMGPEKLSFKEKMKMFAMETGEQETPKDKVKISRAQRNIESNINGT